MTEGSRGEGSQKEEIMAFEHISVLLYETVDGLNVKPDGIYVDATLGGGGHAYEVCSRLGSQGRLIGIDQDADAIRAAGKRLECFGEKVTIVRSNYCDMKQQLQKLGIESGWDHGGSGSFIVSVRYCRKRIFLSGGCTA